MDDSCNHDRCITVHNIDTMSNEEFKSSLLLLIQAKYSEAKDVIIRYRNGNMGTNQIEISVTY